MQTSQLSVIVQTCDRYSDLWRPFYFLFKKYWPDCPYTIYHVSESKILNIQGIKSIATGDLEWSARILKALDQVKSPYILLLLDDYFLLKKVANSDFEKCISILDANPTAAFLRIFPVPGPDRDFKNYSDIGLINKNSGYSISTQTTIWRRNFLNKFLKSEETVWQLETEGSKRAINFSEDFLSLKVNHRKKAEEGNYPYTYLCTAVYKGKWMQEAIDLCKKENIELDLSYRKVETNFEKFYRENYYKMPMLIKHALDFIKSKGWP